MQKDMTRDLLKAFRESRKQVEKSVESVPIKKHTNKRTTPQFSQGFNNISSDPYLKFMEKYAHLEESIDSFKTQDLMYFFREKARESGVKYVIANMKRDMGIFKKLQTNYTPKEVCLMIEFIFNSEQNYLDKEITQPTVLASSWCNTLYRDSLLWVEDKYVPTDKKSTRKDTIKKREWQKEVKGERITIGEWEE